MKKIYYKVVRLKDGKRFSCAAGDKYQVEYPMQEWVTPSVGKLFVFGSYSSAKRFCTHNMWTPLTVKILKCEVQNPVEHRSFKVLQPIVLEGISKKKLKKYWEIILSNQELDTAIFKAYSLSYKVILADAVKCLE